jgi:N-dimethylarginine dimethylaminohydrolase
MAAVYATADALGLDALGPDALDFGALAPLPAPTRVLLTTPDHFEVAYVINPHMADHVGDVDPAVARRQWEALRDAYADLGLAVVTVEGAPGLPDMVFCANQTLPFCHPATGTTGVVLSRMHAAQRRPEVAHYARHFRDAGYDVHRLPDDVGAFEGMGDALWHPGRALLWGGYGVRTTRAAYDHLATALDVPVALLRLHDEDFYHLDTCLCLLDAETALVYPGAFDDDGRALLAAAFPRLIEAPEDEARHAFACNAHCPDGTHVLIDAACPTTVARLADAGFTPVPLDTSEFRKAGGSVFCMKLMHW